MQKSSLASAERILWRGPQESKKVPSLLVAGVPDLVIGGLFEMGKERSRLRQVRLETQGLFELRIGFRRALMRGEDHAEIGVRGRGSEDF